MRAPYPRIPAQEPQTGDPNIAGLTSGRVLVDSWWDQHEMDAGDTTSFTHQPSPAGFKTDSSETTAVLNQHTPAGPSTSGTPIKRQPSETTTVVDKPPPVGPRRAIGYQHPPPGTPGASGTPGITVCDSPESDSLGHTAGAMGCDGVPESDLLGFTAGALEDDQVGASGPQSGEERQQVMHGTPTRKTQLNYLLDAEEKNLQSHSVSSTGQGTSGRRKPLPHPALDRARAARQIRRSSVEPSGENSVLDRVRAARKARLSPAEDPALDRARVDRQLRLSPGEPSGEDSVLDRAWAAQQIRRSPGEDRNV